MMNDVNWWLMALSFLLGLVLTFAFMIRRVTREVPIYAALGRGPKVDVRKPDVEVRKPDVEVRKPDLKATAAGATAATATAATGAAAAKLASEKPYGTGSVRVDKTVAPPRSEYLVKGDEDAMRYFTVESPGYERVEAEVWFQDAESAERAGFRRWDAPGDDTVTEAHGSVDEESAPAKFASVVGEPAAGPYGAGTARAGSGGSGPAGWTIKGNEDSMLYHTNDSPAYEATIAEVWFADEETARKAGFSRWDTKT
jgi:hypothetical protein